MDNVEKAPVKKKKMKTSIIVLIVVAVVVGVLLMPIACVYGFFAIAIASDKYYEIKYTGTTTDISVYESQYMNNCYYAEERLPALDELGNYKDGSLLFSRKHVDGFLDYTRTVSIFASYDAESYAEQVEYLKNKYTLGTTTGRKAEEYSSGLVQGEAYGFRFYIVKNIPKEITDDMTDDEKRKTEAMNRQDVNYGWNYFCIGFDDENHVIVYTNRYNKGEPEYFDDWEKEIDYCWNFPKEYRN